ncbi:MAG: FtsX-like permease family protein, partial [Streptosporangiaceae bacterium]
AMARRTSRPGTLIAARRLADDPRAAFRAVSGLVLALLITTVAVVAITTQNAKDRTRWGSAGEANVLTDQVSSQRSDIRSPGTNQATAGPGPAAPIASLTAQLRGIPGVQGVVVLRADPGLTIPETFHNLGITPYGTGPVPAGAVSCAQLATVPALGRCPAGASAAEFPAGGFGVGGPLFGKDTSTITWPAANVPAARLDTLGVDAINVGTNGTTATVEQVRTVLETARAYPEVRTPSTISDVIAQANSKDNDLQELANVVILVSLPIAGCTLAAGIAAGLADPKRPFSMLRLTGARLAMLRRVVTLESAVPLLAAAAVAIGTGFGATAMYASLEMQHPMVAPGAGYYLLTAGGILTALGIIAASLPLLARITGPDVVRNE